ncbi:MAG: GntR family transcriptional regulator [Pseudomonadota bacterium]
MTALFDTAAAPKLAGRRNLHEEAAARIRKLILDGDLAPGERISEKSLCERFGISRTPIREAIKSLASEGLVEMTPNRGASVTKLSVDDLAAAFPVMGALEALAGELAAEHMGDGEIDHVEALHMEMIRYYEMRELGPYFQVNRLIHEAILAGARNPVLVEHYTQLATRMRLARYRANMSDTRWTQAVNEHGEILDALRKRKAKTLARILRSHLDHKFEVVRAELEA